MARLIDADALPKYTGMALSAAAVAAAVENAPTIEAESRWIPCSERLPEEVGTGEEYPLVIFCTDNRSYVGFYEYYNGGQWWNYTADEDFVVEGVVAWMPLPEPYKEDD